MQKPKLLDQVRNVLRQRNYAIRPKRSKRVPTVLTQEEAFKVLSLMSGVHQIMGKLLYGSGLRLMVWGWN